jgi:hypothetical protein
LRRGLFRVWESFLGLVPGVVDGSCHEVSRLSVSTDRARFAERGEHVVARLPLHHQLVALDVGPIRGALLGPLGAIALAGGHFSAGHDLLLDALGGPRGAALSALPDR